MPITADRRLIKRLLSKHGEEASRQLIELHRADTLGQSSICIRSVYKALHADHETGAADNKTG